jgi:hypothetical protein
MTQTMAEANAALRKAVETRLATGSYDEYVPEDGPATTVTSPLAGCEPAQRCAAEVLTQAWNEASCCEGKPRGPSAAEVIKRFAPERPAASVAWLNANNQLTQLHREKTAQYGGETDPFENVTASAKCGVEPWRRALCDLSDCVVRMQKYAQGQPVDWRKALMDAANWALICYIKLEEEHRD